MVSLNDTEYFLLCSHHFHYMCASAGRERITFLAVMNKNFVRSGAIIMCGIIVK
jgi:hypothetical protein